MILNCLFEPQTFCGQPRVLLLKFDQLAILILQQILSLIKVPSNLGVQCLHFLDLQKVLIILNQCLVKLVHFSRQ
jgi:hypothetical protein